MVWLEAMLCAVAVSAIVLALRVPRGPEEGAPRSKPCRMEKPEDDSEDDSSAADSNSPKLHAPEPPAPVAVTDEPRARAAMQNRLSATRSG